MTFSVISISRMAVAKQTNHALAGDSDGRRFASRHRGHAAVRRAAGLQATGSADCRAG